MQLIKELYDYREMIASLVRRDLKGRYKGSMLGFLWTFINPLLQLCVYTFVFSVVMYNPNISDYYLFLFVALIPWIFFGTSLSAGASCIWSQKEMVKKIYFPREVLPIAFVTSQFVNMLLSFIVIFIVLLFGGKQLSFGTLIYLPFIMLVEYLLALGVTFISSAITVYLRDTEYILGIVAMAWQFLSPVMYSIDQVPQQVLGVFKLNPMTPIITAYRDILYYNQAPKLETLANAFILGIFLLFLGLFVFKKLSKHFAEEL